jgi:hypothetical protein
MSGQLSFLMLALAAAQCIDPFIYWELRNDTFKMISFLLNC